MKNVLIVLVLLTPFAFAVDSYPVEDPVTVITGTDDMLQYDDGISYWVVSGAAYYGTWFDITDFMPGGSSPWYFVCDYTEWWFYHHTSLPWDTDQIVLDLWAGDVTGPATNLSTDTITALHNSPTIVNYGTPVIPGNDFWMIANTTAYSINGVPSVLYDQFNNFTGTAHSFYNQTGLAWEPVVRAGYEIDALFRVDGHGVNSLNSESWGAIKSLFR